MKTAESPPARTVAADDPMSAMDHWRGLSQSGLATARAVTLRIPVGEPSKYTCLPDDGVVISTDSTRHGSSGLSSPSVGAGSTPTSKTRSAGA